MNRLGCREERLHRFRVGDKESSGDAGKGRPDDLIGLVTFARFADSICPLTLDHGNLVNIVKDLSIVSDRSEDGTALGDGLGLAVERLRRSKAKSRVAILLTDGVTNAGVIAPEKAAELAAENDIKVYCIGVGTRRHGPGSGDRLFGRERSLPQPVRNRRKNTRRDRRARPSGRYFRAVDKMPWKASTARSTSWNEPRSPKSNICNTPSICLTLCCRACA